VLRQRLATQGVSQPAFDTPQSAVGFLGAVQAQEFADARWSVGQRVRQCRDNDVLAAFDTGHILRTHMLRPTWHFVCPADIRWLLEATARRVRALNAPYERSLGLDAAVLDRSHALLVEHLSGGRHLTRPQVAGVLAQAGIEASGIRLAYLMMRAELDALVCSGPLQGRQHTYALVQERAPQALVLDHDSAVVQLVRRFFTGHGPASLQDLVRWSSLPRTEARSALEEVAPELASGVVDGAELWWDAGAPTPARTTEAAYLLPGYDEVFAAYPDVGFGHDVSPHGMAVDARFYRPLVVGLDLVGFWRRNITPGGIRVETRDVVPLTSSQRARLHEAARRYGEFASRQVTVVGLA